MKFKKLLLKKLFLKKVIYDSQKLNAQKSIDEDSTLKKLSARTKRNKRKHIRD